MRSGAYGNSAPGPNTWQCASTLPGGSLKRGWLGPAYQSSQPGVFSKGPVVGLLRLAHDWLSYLSRAHAACCHCVLSPARSSATSLTSASRRLQVLASPPRRSRASPPQAAKRSLHAPGRRRRAARRLRAARRPVGASRPARSPYQPTPRNREAVHSASSAPPAQARALRAGNGQRPQLAALRLRQSGANDLAHAPARAPLSASVDDASRAALVRHERERRVCRASTASAARCCVSRSPPTLAPASGLAFPAATQPGHDCVCRAGLTAGDDGRCRSRRPGAKSFSESYGSGLNSAARTVPRRAAPGACSHRSRRLTACAAAMPPRARLVLDDQLLPQSPQLLPDHVRRQRAADRPGSRRCRDRLRRIVLRPRSRPGAPASAATRRGQYCPQFGGAHSVDVLEPGLFERARACCTCPGRARRRRAWRAFRLRWPRARRRPRPPAPPCAAGTTTTPSSSATTTSPGLTSAPAHTTRTLTEPSVALIVPLALMALLHTGNCIAVRSLTSRQPPSMTSALARRARGSSWRSRSPK